MERCQSWRTKNDQKILFFYFMNNCSKLKLWNTKNHQIKFQTCQNLPKENSKNRFWAKRNTILKIDLERNTQCLCPVCVDEVTRLHKLGILLRDLRPDNLLLGISCIIFRDFDFSLKEPASTEVFSGCLFFASNSVLLNVSNRYLIENCRLWEG
jgi:serine/threonine protein kinase